MAKRRIRLDEVQTLIELGTLIRKSEGHGWIAHHFDARNDNLIYAAIITDQAVIVKTVMVNWKERGA